MVEMAEIVEVVAVVVLYFYIELKNSNKLIDIKKAGH